MGSKMANNGPHAAGIFADMTVDGPEIGTLVVIVDRAKNLPNRKTMGKQNPYAAARLGKEARKTETDKRGGQTPRWDQELRFTVHDSPDYYTLKLSVFSEDKRTDLIGEAWLSLTEVVVPGGGKSDVWQQLNCKGKYAGEIRIELTYYDSREKQEKEKIVSVADELKQTYGSLGGSKVKRRPLPVNPNAPNTTPVVIPERALPGRAKHGPRDIQTPPRANSLPPEVPKTYNYPHSQSTLIGQTPALDQHPSVSAGSTPVHPDSVPNDQYYGEYDPNLGPQTYEPESYEQPDFLPQLGPRRTPRGPLPAQAQYAPRPLPPQQQPREMSYPQAAPHHPQAHAPLPHSHSAPAVPTQPENHGYDDSYQLRTDFPEPIPDVDYQYQQARQRRGSNVPLEDRALSDPYGDRQPYIEDEEPEGPPPPPPPMHSNSSPAVPHYGSPYSRPFPPPSSARYGQTPPRQQLVPNSSPLQSIERGYGQYQTPPSQRHPPRGRSVDEYGTSPYQASYGSTPNLTPPNQTPPSQGSAQYGRPYPSSRHSVADPYGTPSRPHPLSQEVSRARSPNPYAREPPSSAGYQHDYQGRDAVPLIKPRAINPQPVSAPASAPPSSRPKNTYSLQHPIRAFESSDESPLSTSQPGYGRAPVRGSAPPTRKSVSPRPSISEGSAIPFSPDSFDVHNPNVGDNTSPTRSGPIVGWHGQEIDPSDHLPVDSWAPEPKKKTPDKTYGLGRDRDFGPRSAQGITNTSGRVSKDTMINVRMRQQQAPPPEPEPQSSGKIRARLVKKAGHGSSPIAEPLRDHTNFNPVPNPYEQQQFSRSFTEGINESYGSRYDTGYGPPALPPKVPLQQQQDYYGTDALSREISSIDIGSSRRGPAPPSFVPVRSHRDRNSYY